jgi:branched-chain amino acid transport system permease protein
MAMVKHDEVVAGALGVDVQRLKILAFAAGALVAGVGGALYAHYAMYIQYSDFGADKAMAILTYAVFGGIDVWFGGVLGATVLSYMPVLLQVFDHWRLEIYGAIILLVMSLRPQGVLALDLSDRLRDIWQHLKPAWRHSRPVPLEPLPPA